MPARFVAATALAAAAYGCAAGDDAAPLAQAGDLAITRAVAPAPVADAPGALYFTVVNRGTVDDTLLAVESPAASSAMIHDQVRSGGTMTMAHVDRVPVPAGDSVRLAPGGLHVMLDGLRAPIAAGDTIAATLTFSRAGRVELRVPVVTYAELEGRA